MMAAMDSPLVALVSGDLLFASRLRATLGSSVPLTVVRGGTVPVADTVFVDLNDDVEARLATIRELRARGGTRVIGFCQHDQRELRIRAMAGGADQVVTNGALQQAAVRLVGAGTGG